MRAFALAAFFACASAAAQPVVNPLAPHDMQPGYGVVDQVTAVRVKERSAAAGGSAEPRPVYRVKVRMADGGVQFRDVDRPEVRPGDRVLLTNAGDVVPDFARDAGEARRGGAGPAEPSGSAGNRRDR